MAKSPKLKDMPKSLAREIRKLRRKKKLRRRRDPKTYKEVKLDALPLPLSQHDA